MRATDDVVVQLRPSSVPPEVARVVLDSVPGMVGYWDRDLRNVLANRAYLEFFGRTPESLVGVHIREVLGEAVFAANLPYMLGALAGEKQVFDRTLADASGHDRHMQACYTPHSSLDGISGFVVQVTDVTDRVNAERELRRSARMYRALAASVPDGFVLLFDTDLRYLIAEGPALAAFGHAQAELEGRTIHDVLPDQLATELESRYRAVLAGQTVEWERRAQDRTYSLKAGPVWGEHGEVFAGTVFAQDVTTARRAQAVQSALHEIATLVARAASPDTICAQIAANLTCIFNADTAAVVRFTAPDRGEIVVMAPRRPAGISRQMSFGPDDWSATAQVAATGRPALVNYRPQREGVVGALQSEGFKAGAASPIHHDGKLWGAIALGAQSVDGLTTYLLSELTGFAELIEIALGNLQAWSSLAQQAACDALTGLPNRRSLDAHLERELAAVNRTGEPLSLAVMDIDHFKKINDRFGHSAGDRVLADISTVFTGAVRDSEMVARTGGEEFVWVLPHTSTAAAIVAAERARQAVEVFDFGPIGQVTISIGVCSTSDIAESTSLLDAADQALYRAKRAGRNTVVAFRTADIAATT